MRIWMGVALLLIACGDDGASTPVDAPLPPVDMGAPPALVGKWQLVEYPNMPLGEDIVVTFNADGTMLHEQGRFTVNGFWLITADNQLTISVGGNSDTFDFLVLDDVFLHRVLLPSGAVDGRVGTWTTTSRLGSTQMIETVMLGADMSATYMRNYGGDVDHFAGTWELREDTVHMEGLFNGDLETAIGYHSVPDVALAADKYVRVP
jgi:hypothetical protein